MKRRPDTTEVVAGLDAELQRLLVDRERIQVRRRAITAALRRIDAEREVRRIDELLGLR